MHYQSNPYLVWQLISIVTTLGITVYIQTRPRKKRESTALALVMFAGAIWSLGNLIQWMSTDFGWQVGWNIVVYIGIVIIPTAWFLFSLRYTGIGLFLLDNRQYLFWIVPILTYVAIITNDIHHLFFSSQEIVVIRGFSILSSTFGVLFYIHMGYSYLLLFAGMLVLGYSLITNFKKYGIHAYGLIIGVLAPLVGNIYFLFGPIPEGFPDPTPLFFAVTGIAFAWTIFGSRMLEVIELAHDSIVQNLSNGIVVLDLEGNILDINPAAIQVLGLSEQPLSGIPLLSRIQHNNVYDFLKQNLYSNSQEDATINIQMEGIFKSFELVVSNIQDKLGLTTGKLLEIWDVSEKVKAEERLASTREAFESTMDTLQDSYFEADPTGRIIYANKAMVANLGFDSFQDMADIHFRSFTERSVVRDIVKKFKKLYETKQPLEPFEYHYRTTDGKSYIGETVVSPILEGDEVVGSRGTIRDVTDRVKAEREIAAQKDLLDGLLQNAPFAIVINDLNMKITVTNPAFEKIFGYSPAEVVGLCLDDLLSTPEILEQMQTLSEKSLNQEMFSTGKRRTKEGNLVDVDISSLPFFVNGEKLGTLVFYQDISDRLKVESELQKTQITTREILDSLEDPYFESSKDGTILYINEALVRAVDYPSKDALIGKNFRHITARSNIRQVYEQFSHLYETKKPLEPFEYIYRKRDGSLYVGETVVSPIIEDGEVIGSRGIVRDISVRIKAEEVLREAKEAAEYRAGELAAINRMAEKVGQTLDLQEILDAVCQELTNIFEVKNAGIGLLNKEKDILEIIAFHTNIPGGELPKGVMIPVEGNSYLTEMMTNKRTIVIQNAQTDPRTQASHELYRDRGTKSIMIVPLLVRGVVIGNIGLPALDPDHKFSENEIELAETIASQVASAVDNAQLYTQTETALGAAESDLEIGSQIQSGFFPFTIPNLPGWEIATHFHSARQVAGDFYDTFQFKGSDLTAFVIADVCDKGVGAALFMVLFRSLLRAFSDFPIDQDNIHDSLLEIINKTNNYIAEIHGPSNMFATVFFGILNPQNGELHYVNGGHEPPIIMNEQGEITHRLMPTGPAVGLLPNLPFAVSHIELDLGDILVGFTDGATDAKNSEGKLFTENRLKSTIQAPWTSVFSMIFELDAELQSHMGEQAQFDDITLIALRRKVVKGVDNHAICRPAKLSMLGDLRQFVESAAQHSGLNSEDVFSFKLSAEEILTNIMQYGYEGKDPGLIALSFELDHQKAVMKIWDDGAYFPLDHVDVPDVNAGWEERKLGGLGIYFVKELMDKVSYVKDKNQTNLLVLEKNLK